MRNTIFIGRTQPNEHAFARDNGPFNNDAVLGTIVLKEGFGLRRPWVPPCW